MQTGDAVAGAMSADQEMTESAVSSLGQQIADIQIMKDKVQALESYKEMKKRCNNGMQWQEDERE